MTAPGGEAVAVRSAAVMAAATASVESAAPDVAPAPDVVAGAVTGPSPSRLPAARRVRAARGADDVLLLGCGTTDPVRRGRCVPRWTRTARRPC